MAQLDLLLESFARILPDLGAVALLLAFVAGVITSLLPCFFSTIPLIIGYVGGTATDAKRGFALSAMFALGMALTMTVLGILAALAGQLFLWGGRWFYLIVGALMILMSLQLFGVYEFIPSTYLTSVSKRRGMFGALLTGILAGLFASPCSTPVLIVLLSLVATQGNVVWGILLLLSFSLGHAVLIIAIGTSVGLARHITSSPRYGTISTILQIMMALLTLALGLYMLYLGF